MDITISGIHHITAIASDPQQNLDFYTQFLGLRLVKLTVNFDDPTTYHFYFGDQRGQPGTILTFFPWPGARRGRHGTGQVSRIAFAVAPGALAYWIERAKNFNVTVQGPWTRFGEDYIELTDPDGLQLEIIATRDAHQGEEIAGFHSASLWVEGYERTARLLTGSFGFIFEGSEGNRYRYRASRSGPASLVDVVCSPDAAPGSLGAGIVHHIAWRAPNEGQQRQWRSDLAGAGFNVTPVMDRRYFRSIYFREPGGILFEIATDPPGFLIDETESQLGSQLQLPPWLEPQRAYIESRLPAIRIPSAARQARTAAHSAD